MSDSLRTAILAAASAVDGARAELGVLDGAAGDGDHGMTMSIGARNVRRRLQASDHTAPADVVREVALGMSDVGGAIGPLYATALDAIAAVLEAAGPGATADVPLLRRCAEAAEQAASNLGHAQPGDKTVIDALHPLVVALRDAEARSVDLNTAIGLAVQAADTGAEATTDMVARIGRASRLGERSRGMPDAGATSFAIVVRALAAG